MELLYEAVKYQALRSYRRQILYDVAFEMGSRAEYAGAPSKVYPFTAPATRPLIIYFWKKKKIAIIGIIPTMEMVLMSDQS